MEADPSFDPPALRERPDLWPAVSFYSGAFHDLSADRPLGSLGGCGSIPWSVIERYADRYGVHDLDDFERFVRMIRAQDRIYLEHVAEQAKAASKK